MSDDTLPIDNADDDLANPWAEGLEGTLPYVADVRVHGPVRTQDVAVNMPTARSITLTTTTEVIAPGDPRRSRLVMIAATADFYFGTSRNLTDANNSAVWPAGIPLEIRGRNPIFAKSAGAATVFSFYIEQLG